MKKLIPIALLLISCQRSHFESDVTITYTDGTIEQMEYKSNLNPGPFLYNNCLYRNFYSADGHYSGTICCGVRSYQVSNVTKVIE